MLVECRWINKTHPEYARYCQSYGVEKIPMTSDDNLLLRRWKIKDLEILDLVGWPYDEHYGFLYVGDELLAEEDQMDPDFTRDISQEVNIKAFKAWRDYDRPKAKYFTSPEHYAILDQYRAIGLSPKLWPEKETRVS